MKNEGMVEGIDADLAKYFDTIPHRELMQSVARRIVDRNVLRLIKMWLKTPVEERDEQGKRRMSGGRHSTCGTPQGGVVTPRTQKVTLVSIPSSAGWRRFRVAVIRWHGDRDRVPDNDTFVVDQNFLDEEAHDPLSLLDFKGTS